MNPVHATAVALACPAGWRGTLLLGPSGAGKSDLALRLLGRGWALVGDDYVHVWASEGGLYAAPVARIAGRIEARGLGILTAGHRPSCRIVLAVDCRQQSIERLPEADTFSLAGVAVSRLALDIRPASAIETLTLAIRRL